MQRSAARRWLAATGIAAALVVSSAVSAAAEPAPTLGVVLPDTLVAPGSAGTETDPVVFMSESAVLHDFTVKYDLAGISSFADVAFDDFFCDRVASEITCVYEDQSFDQWGGSLIGLTIAPKATAAEGDEGDLTVTVSADGLASVSDTAKVSVGQGVDLAAEIAPNPTSSPRGAYDEKLGVQNVGTTTAHGAVLLFFGDYAIEAGAARYSNCTYDGDQYRACVFDTDLAAGKSYGNTFPFRLRGDTMAPGKEFIEFSWLTPAEWEAEKSYLRKLGFGDVIGEPGTGPAVTLAEKAKGPVEVPEQPIARPGVKQVDTEPSDNWTASTITVTGSQPADIAAFGAQASGVAGAEVDVQLGAQNHGPAAIDQGRSGESIVDVLFTVPPGATAVQAPMDCYPFKGAEPDFEHPGQAGAKKYLCFPGVFLAPGDKAPFAFKLRLDTVKPDAKGEVKVANFFNETPLPSIIDRDRANDVAYVELNDTGAPSPTPGTNPGLPVTGTRVAVVSTVGLLALAFGFVLFRIARRRRLTEV
jgi:hypothetical protein